MKSLTTETKRLLKNKKPSLLFSVFHKFFKLLSVLLFLTQSLQHTVILTSCFRMKYVNMIQNRIKSGRSSYFIKMLMLKKAEEILKRKTFVCTTTEGDEEKQSEREKLNNKRQPIEILGRGWCQLEVIMTKHARLQLRLHAEISLQHSMTCCSWLARCSDVALNELIWDQNKGRIKKYESLSVSH